LRPIPGFSQPDYSVVDKDGDTQRVVGRIYSTGVSSDRATRWFWTLSGEYWPHRPPPHGGLASSLEEAKAAFRRCWQSVSEQA